VTQIPGISFSIQGTPAVGDTFTVKPSTDQSLFTTVQNLITAFRTNIAGNATLGATVRNTINAGMANLDQALTNVSNVQASIGSRMSELNSLSNISADLNLQYQSKISALQDLDYPSAISQFETQQLQLQAAQKSFAQISGLSLFNYL
jgi:flagellar hook-associated protein 3 FlgL